MSHCISDLYIKIGRVIKWLPVLWKDLDYDGDSLFFILKCKLECLRAGIERDIDFNEKPQVLSEIDECLDALNRVCADEYMDDKLKAFDSDLHSLEGNVFTMPAEDRKALIELCDKADALRQKDIDLIFNLLKNRHSYWWA